VTIERRATPKRYEERPFVPSVRPAATYSKGEALSEVWMASL
jgi:hypothetical protein